MDVSKIMFLKTLSPQNVRVQEQALRWASSVNIDIQAKQWALMGILSEYDIRLSYWPMGWAFKASRGIKPKLL